MGEGHEVQLQIRGNEAKETNHQPRDPVVPNHTAMPQPMNNYRWWFLVVIYSVFLLAGQSVATLLARLYFDRGGNSNWMATFVQPCGFMILLPLYFISSAPKNPDDANTTTNTSSPSFLVLMLIYISFGIFIAADCMFYSLGQKYLPVSTFSLLCASQLGFNALFSFFLNSQKFTPFIVNSLVLLTISSALLVFQGKSVTSVENPEGKYAVGFICTVVASAGYGLLLSLTQFAFRKILKQANFKVVLDMIIYPSVVATCVVLVGLFASGEWKGLSGEMHHFELGKVSYLMTLIWIAISWQVFNIGCVGLVYQVSSLFSNVISTLGLPVVPVLAVLIFGDKMNGIKGISLVLAIWGFVSYMYQHYLDDYKSSVRTADTSREISNDSHLKC
ncbi:hypothetical protein Tsubulata_002239 [Turnera subulata]|uniref:Probable purine permease n=1 Tax=Turnera subulata TaxID=218843 RepID=A0A9Q0J3U4_9ROSI|nr:hypothetical protein Tsubulata_002239 [Turnera subulata]